MKNLDRRVTGLPVGGELDIPDVFIYLVRSGKNISYIRLPIEEIGSLEAEPEWLKFNVDWAVG